MQIQPRLACLVALALLTACGASSDTPREQQHRSDPPQKVADGPGARFSVAGFEFQAPENWVPVAPSSPMRKASFEFGPVQSDTEKAEMHAFYFGPDQGGSVESNIDRWLGQMTMAEGQEPEREEFTAAGYPVHIVRASGSYAMSMGGPMSGQSEQKPGWRLLGGIVEGSQGNIFFRIAGPEQTVQAMEPGFKAMLEGLSQGRE